MIKPIVQVSSCAKYMFLQDNIEFGSFEIISKDDHKEIWCFGIKASHQNQGLGQQMLRECLEMLSGNIVELGCVKGNDVALYIYKKFGFKIVKDCGDYYWLRKEVRSNGSNN